MDRRQEGCDFLHPQPGFGILRRDIHLQVTTKRVPLAPLGQLLGHFDAVQSMKSEGDLGHVLRFVSLQGANRMPTNAGDIAQLRRLFPQFLRVVFPEVALSGLAGLADRNSGAELGNREQRHRVGRAIGAAKSRFNAATYRIPIAAYAFDYRVQGNTMPLRASISSVSANGNPTTFE